MGKDVKKTTFVSFSGVEGATELARELVAASVARSVGSGPRRSRCGTCAIRGHAAELRRRQGLEMAKCPECEVDLELDGYDLDLGETTNCPECSVELVVVSTDPIGVRAEASDEEE